MNGNRNKYTYTPTYGMQKRGVLKRNAPVREIPEAPDFTQIPDPAIGVPLQQTNQQLPYPTSAPQAGVMPPPSYFAAGTQQQQPSQQPFQPQYPVQTPFAAPVFVQPSNYAAQMPPVQNMQANSFQQPPLRSGTPSVGKSAGFSSRAQGFVPPTPHHTQPVQQQFSPAPQIGWAAPKPAQQTIPPFSAVQPPIAQPTQPFQPVQPQSYPPLQPVAQQPGFTIQPAAPVSGPRRAAIDADKLWGIFLFGLLPVLFIPCLFVPSALDILRYIFLGAAVAGLGVMWYRQLYSPASRMIISIVYVAFCVTVMAMLMQGGSDARQTAANMAQETQQTVPTETPAPNQNLPAVAFPEETPAPAVIGPSEAEKRLSLFMDLWKINNTSEMVYLVQPSWRNQQEDAPAALFLALANRTPEDFTIEDISGTETDSSRTVTMRATINKNTGKAPVVYRFMVMMVKEGNEWYVNPNSLATNDTTANTTDEEENVVKTQGNTTVTEPPRETVTPAPPASTLLYYNVGGNYYHMDPQCPSVATDFLPFDASFSYSDLRSYNNTFLPCLNCNAPIDPLD